MFIQQESSLIIYSRSFYYAYFKEKEYGRQNAKGANRLAGRYVDQC
ncbi:hypothetical protein [Neobacillus cucumis]|nr:hypothetical protein [Neobacillus cucumis]MBM7656083.1 hypothetical protein [Neobacillus cucumis]